MSIPQLSIIIPVYNDIKISRALDSIRPYKDMDCEIIVIDGNSNNEIKEILKKYRNVIDILISEPDQGPYDAANKGIRLANGKWILWFASDDVMIVNPVKIVSKYDTNDYDVICGSIVAQKKNGSTKVIRSSANLNRLSYHCSLRQPATFFRREKLLEVGLYSMKYKYSADRELFLRLREQGARFRIIDCNIVFFSYGGLTTSKRVIDSYLEDYLISTSYGINKFVSFTIFILRFIYFKCHNFMDKLLFNNL